MLRCKNYEYYRAIKTEGYGLCSLPDSFVPTKAETICPYLMVKKQYCKDCVYLTRDMGCAGVDPQDGACSDFVSRDMESMEQTIYEMAQRGIDARSYLNKLLDEIDKSPITAFIKAHKEDVMEKEE
ncbi:MAG: hypothetical protein MJ094_01300 [Saccharofermentans sp.]|nr:hypothetical protein [Saccharofermentans sp.]